MSILHRVKESLALPDRAEDDLRRSARRAGLASRLSSAETRWLSWKSVLQVLSQDPSPECPALEILAQLFDAALLESCNAGFGLYDLAPAGSLDAARARWEELPDAQARELIAGLDGLGGPWREKGVGARKEFFRVPALADALQQRWRDRLYELGLGAWAYVRFSSMPPALALTRLGNEAALLVEGSPYPLVNRHRGMLEGIAQVGDEAQFMGWAGDIPLGKPASWVVIFVGDRAVAVGSPSEDREDIAKIGDSGVLRSGFFIAVKAEQAHIPPNGTVRAFALFEDKTATELRYGENLPFRP